MDSPECREKQNCLDWCSTLTMLRSFGSTPHAGCWLVTTRKTNYIFRLRDPESNLHLQLLLSGVRSNHWVGKVGKCRLLIHARSSPKKKSTVKPGDGNVGRLFSTGKIVFKKQFRSTQQVKDYFFDSFQEAKNQADSEVIHFAKPSDQNQHPKSKHLGGYKELLESGWWGTVL